MVLYVQCSCSMSVCDSVLFIIKVYFFYARRGRWPRSCCCRLHVVLGIRIDYTTGHSLRNVCPQSFNNVQTFYQFIRRSSILLLFSFVLHIFHHIPFVIILITYVLIVVRGHQAAACKYASRQCSFVFFLRVTSPMSAARRSKIPHIEAYRIRFAVTADSSSLLVGNESEAGIPPFPRS